MDDRKATVVAQASSDFTSVAAAHDSDMTDASCRRLTGDRRRHTLWSFIYGSFRPRRRGARRVEEERWAFIDWYDSHNLYLALSILLLSCLDALFTLNLIAAGGEEINIFMKPLVNSDVGSFLAVKIGITGLSVVILTAAAHYHIVPGLPVLRLLQAICAGYATLICYEIYLLGLVLTSPDYDGPLQHLRELL